MSDTIKYDCPNCGAKYRLPLEAQGRTARCKKCGNKFQVPREHSLEDSILDWLNEPDPDEETVAPPRVINMPADHSGDDSKSRVKGPIRMKSPSSE